MNHPINEGKGTTIPIFSTNNEVPNITDNCTGTLQCELFYELDWSYYLTVTSDCGSVVVEDPCFGTEACVCSNNYYRIVDTMPEYNGTNDLLKVVEEAMVDLAEEIALEIIAKTNNDDDSNDAWIYIVIACSVIVVGILVGGGIYYGKQMKEKKDGENIKAKI